ncbi:MAG: pseudouridine synthase [Cyanobacteria bacterium J069]|nr:MAG: rRNA pseudouridine synthase [Cyanobacteria bacterium J069]
MAERIQKILSQYGIASRRQAEQLILAGRVRLNGQVATLGQSADLTGDRLEVDGQLLKPQARPDLLYLLLHKPTGVLSTCDDPQRRRTVLDLLPAHLRQASGLHPVGRLDANSTGALLLTNDGAITFSLTHPSHHIPKTYEVWVAGHPHPTTLRHWREGVWLDGRPTLPAEVTPIDERSTQTLLRVVLREGRNRQIRRVAEQLGHPVIALHRVAIGPVELGRLPVGRYRPLTSPELIALQDFLDAQTRNFTKTPLDQ